MKALIVEDCETNALILQVILLKLKFYISRAHDGKQAVEMCEDEFFDFIFMDIQMPVMSGDEAIFRIRKNEIGTNKRSTIIVVSANFSAEDCKKYYSLGADSVLGKPLSKDELLKKIKNKL